MLVVVRLVVPPRGDGGRCGVRVHRGALADRPLTRAADRPSTLAARDNVSDAARRLIEPLCVDDHLAPSVFLVDAGACGESSLRDDVATHLRAIRPMPGASREDAPGYFDADDRDLIPTRWSRWLRSNADECAAVAADVDVAAAAEDVDVADAGSSRADGASPRRPGVFATRHRAAHPRRVPRTVPTRRPAIHSHGVRPGVDWSARRDENALGVGKRRVP